VTILAGTTQSVPNPRRVILIRLSKWAIAVAIIVSVLLLFYTVYWRSAARQRHLLIKPQQPWSYGESHPIKPQQPWRHGELQSLQFYVAVEPVDNKTIFVGLPKETNKKWYIAAVNAERSKISVDRPINKNDHQHYVEIDIMKAESSPFGVDEFHILLLPR
jgi:hypothetical protein